MKSLEKILGPEKFNRDKTIDNNVAGVVTGLAWTEFGGEILKIETVNKSISKNFPS